MKVPDVKFYSEKTKKFYKLLKTKTWPTVEISGIHMHRIKEVDPKTDTELKLKTLGRIYGIILDTCTGLGYTAILAAKRKGVRKVITVEKDKNVIHIAKLNPFSKELFENPKIELRIADITKEIKKFDNEFFNFIIHDPPRISIAPELYSLNFYKQMFRVLKNNGKIFHYVGRPGIKQRKMYIKGIINRLRLAGFKSIDKKDYALGLFIRK
jgi:hypothetical protein